MPEHFPWLASTDVAPVPLSLPLLALAIAALALAIIFGAVLRSLSGFAAKSKNQLAATWLFLKKNKKAIASALWGLVVFVGRPSLAAAALVLGSYLGLLFGGVVDIFIQSSIFLRLDVSSTLRTLALGQVFGAYAAIWFGLAGPGLAYELATAFFAAFFTRLFWRTHCYAIFVELLAYSDTNWGTEFLFLYYGYPFERFLWGPEHFPPLRDLARYVFSQTRRSRNLS